uniref:Uncharacterized protein n=1 Tax=Coptotermes formosanus TaxID=36987 RepID=R4UK89_COPFO|nr:hypothetical protein [Coptotermes formosanus]
MKRFISTDQLSNDEIKFYFDLVFSDNAAFSTLFTMEKSIPNFGNPSIDEKNLNQFITKMSNVPKLFDQIIKFIVDEAKYINQNKNNLTISLMRSLLILFTFPQIFCPGPTEQSLSQLISCYNSSDNTFLTLFITWLSQLDFIRKQMIGACHHSISSLINNASSDFRSPAVRSSLSLLFFSS